MGESYMAGLPQVLSRLYCLLSLSGQEAQLGNRSYSQGSRQTGPEAEHDLLR